MITRHDEGPRRFAEPEFAYLNRSASQDVSRIRELLEAWFACCPASAQADLCGRFRSPDNTPHRSAFFELFLHALLLRLGGQVEMHPGLHSASTRRPDFLVDSPSSKRFYLEAVVTGESAEETKAQARMHVVYDALNQMDSPDFYIGMKLYGAPATPPPARRIRNFLEQKLAPLNPDNIALRLTSTHHVPHWRYEHDGWEIDFFPIPKPSEMRGNAGVRPEEKQVSRSLVTWFHPERQLYLTEAIRDGVLKKAGRYGELDLPYVIAINVLDSYMPVLTGRGIIEGHLLTALFGPDGALRSSSGPRYRRVSAVLLTALQSAWDISRAYICLCHNPYAQKPYTAELTRFPQLLPRNGQMELQPGASSGEIFGLPSGWP